MRNDQSKSGARPIDLRGIELRKGKEKESIRLTFTYKGVLCKETLKLDHSPKNLKYAAETRSAILNGIERGTFIYYEFFPNSAKAKQFGRVPTKKTVGELLRAQLDIAEKSQSPSTYRGYKQVCDSHLLSQWDRTPITEFTRADLKDWIGTLKCKKKTITNILTPLRNVVSEALNDGIIDENPFDRLVLDKLLSREQKQSEFVVDPFSMSEIEAILPACSSEPESNLWQCFFGCGMRTSELLALEWSCVDFERRKILVRRKRVEGKTEQVLKTAAGKRDIDMRQGAYEALMNQRKYTQSAGKHVFIDDRIDTPWGNDHILRMRWIRILRKAGVRYRNPYQTRHTYASSLLGSGANPLYVANQMGHATLEMIQRRYGRWIEQGTDEKAQKRLADFYAPVLPQAGKEKP
jgi:integrase